MDSPLLSPLLSDEGIAKLIDLLEHGSDALRCGDLCFGDTLMLFEKAIVALRGVRDGRREEPAKITETCVLACVPARHYAPCPLAAPSERIDE